MAGRCVIFLCRKIGPVREEIDIGAFNPCRKAERTYDEEDWLVIGKDGPRRYQVRKAYLTSTLPMQEVRSDETVAFFREFGDVTSSEGRVRAVKAREILENCYYPHVTKEARRTKGN